MSDISVPQIEALLDMPDAIKKAIRRANAARGTYEAFIGQLYEDIDSCLQGLHTIANQVQPDGEDRLTSDVILPLLQLGYKAKHDAMAGGHVDITVDHGPHTWIAEAKLDWEIDEGMKQLTTRYVAASGNPDHDHGGLIFYLKRPDVTGIMRGWRQKLEARGIQCKDCDRSRLAFYSQVILKATGLPFHVRSIGVALYWHPEDASGQKTRKRRAARQGKKATAAKGSAPTKASAARKATKQSSKQNHGTAVSRPSRKRSV